METIKRLLKIELPRRQSAFLWGPRGHKVTHRARLEQWARPSEAQHNLTGGSPVVACG